MRSNRRLGAALMAVGTALSLSMSCAKQTSTSSDSTPSASNVGATDDLAAARAFFASAPQGRVIAKSAVGHARFIVGSRKILGAAPNFSPETAARAHLSLHARLLGLNQAALNDAVVSGLHDLSEGASIVQFKQRVAGIDVFQARASVVLDPARNLVSLANGFVPSPAKPSTKQFDFQLAPEAAIARAYATAAGVKLPAGAVIEGNALGDEFRVYGVRAPDGAMRVLDLIAKRVLYPGEEGFVPAYYIELLGRGPGSQQNVGRGYVVAADDGRVLHDVSLTANDAFNYRVWAETTGNKIPTDGPMVDFSPHPTGKPDDIAPMFRAPVLVSMESFKTKPAATVDPWLPATATYAWGNNVRAYSDRNNSFDVEAGLPVHDGFDEGVDLRAELTSAKTFDRIYDVTKAPESSPDQIKASVTQLFYVTNWLHDYWYDSGFDEKSGVAQISNFGRGGVEGDPLNAEAQDSALAGAINNANMTVMSDGRSPRMQMFVWRPIRNRQLVTTPALKIADGLGASNFAPLTFNVRATIVLANDGDTAVVPPSTDTGTTSDACQEPLNVTGRIAVVDLGGCGGLLKLQNVQAAGGLGVIVIYPVSGHLAPDISGSPPPGITIPVLSVSQEDGAALKTLLATRSVTATMSRGAEVQLDGTLDNTIVAHEWGHYLHHRLVQCGSKACGGMSEGFADFSALLMMIREGDTFDGKTYAVATYATAASRPTFAYFGIRRAPYSTDLTKNPFTFRHIANASPLPTTAPLVSTVGDMTEVHNVGEIWAQALFEAYASLLTAAKTATPPRPFEETKRRMHDYVVAGMKAAPNEPTFTEMRDAFLSSVIAIPGRTDDFVALAKGFAKRGMGSDAESPPPFSNAFDDVVESFEDKGRLVLYDATLDDSVRSCDRDGILDKGEKGNVTIEVQNTGWQTLTASKLKLTTTDPNIELENGGVAVVPKLGPYEVQPVKVGVSVKDAVVGRVILPLTVTLSDPMAVTPTADTDISLSYNFNEEPNVAAADDFEIEPKAWTRAPMASRLPLWSWFGDATGHFFHADDFAVAADESLVSPSLVVSPTNPFVVSFSHRYWFEFDQQRDGSFAYHDGAVLELSEDDGKTWKDISNYADAPYPVTLATLQAPRPDGGAGDSGPMGVTDTNSLAGRQAWGGLSPAYPDFATVSIDLGTKLAGKTVKIRFRVGTDDDTGNYGWDIDNVTFGSTSFPGITNRPFPAIVDNSATACSDAGGGITDAAAPDVRNDDGAGGSIGSGGSIGTGGSGAGGSAGAGGCGRDGCGTAGSGGKPVIGGSGGSAGMPSNDSSCACTTRRSSGSSAFATLSALLALFASRRRKR